ncbi:unnamed protein product [Clavelina lepadiformis]|uniref:SET domain-containing protein n=1 Tax=Clavelina lepadiformis TaxID=159417 RepID=A0ABP0EUJ6_CLALP
MRSARGRTSRQRKRKDRDFFKEVDKNLINLQRWMKTVSFKADGLAVAEFKGTGRGLIAKKNLYPGDVILSTPCEVLIGVAKACRESHWVKTVLGLHSSIGIHALCLFLIEERRKLNSAEKGSNVPIGKWDKYVKVLPDHFTHPVCWNSDVLCLLPPDLLRKVVSTRSKVEGQVKLINKLICMAAKHKLLQKLCGRDGTFGLLQEEISVEEYKWAWCCVNTRCVYSDHDPPKLKGLQPSEADNYFLVPFLDLLNHSVGARVEAKYNKLSKKFEIKTLNSVKKYSQVFIHYGAHSNGFLLTEYGFIDESQTNYDDNVPCQWRDLLENHNFEENVADMMTSLLEKYSINGGLCFTYVAPSWSLSITLLLLQLFASDCVDNPEATFLSLLAYKLPSKHCQEVLESARRILLRICTKKREFVTGFITRCNRQLVICKPNDKLIVEMISKLWNIYNNIIKINCELINSNQCFCDFS